MKEKILLLDAIPDDLYQRLSQEAELYDARALSRDERAHYRNTFRIGLANGESQITAANLSPFPSLELIAIYGVGYDGVDLECLKARGITLTNTPDVLTQDVADLALSFMLELSRDTRSASQFVADGLWQTGRFALRQKFSGSRVGIVGLGRIGMAIARRLHGFDIEVFYTGRCDRNLPDCQYLPSLAELAHRVDFLVIAANASVQNRHLIDESILTQLGATGYLVNVARGSLINEAHLIAALDSGLIAGAALDVLESEPHVPPALLHRPNVLLTPHIASATHQTRAAMTQRVLENIAAFQAGKPLISAVETE